MQTNKPAQLVRVVDHWINCIDANQATAPAMPEGIYSQLLMELTHQSNEMGKQLSVPTL